MLVVLRMAPAIDVTTECREFTREPDEPCPQDPGDKEMKPALPGSEADSPPSEEPSVSIVIPTRNSARTIETCLRSIANQSYPHVETIVVDQESTDGTKEIARRFDVKLISVPHGGLYIPPTRSRNAGTAAASGAYVAHLDSDMELSPRLVRSCVDLCIEGAEAVIVPEVDSTSNFWGRCKALERSCYLGDPVIETPRFFLKDKLVGLGGYDETIHAGEDWDINFRARQARLHIGRTHEFVLHHIEDFDFFRNLQKKYYYARSLQSYQRKHPEGARQTLTFARPAFWNNRRNLARDPVHAVGAGIQKLLEGYFVWRGMKRPLGEGRQS